MGIKEEELEFAKEKKRLLSKAAKEIKKLQKKEQEVLENLDQCCRWAEVRHEGELIKSQFSSIRKGASSLTVHDWLTDQAMTIPLDPTKTAKVEMEARFRKAKKLQTGIIPLTRFLKRVQEQLQKAKQKEEEIGQAASLEELASFMTTQPCVGTNKATYGQSSSSAKKSGKEIGKALSPIYREFLSASGFKIWVGKNAKANDSLTFQIANGRDWWLHINGCPGSHVVIRVMKDQEPDSETLKDGMQLALYFSKARPSGEGEVCLTQRKYVSKMAKAGQAQISQHKTLWVRLDPERIRSLQERTRNQAT